MIRVVAAIVEKEASVLIGRRAAGLWGEGKWEFPGGKVRDGEADAAALEREMLEETGLRVRVGRLLDEIRHDYETRSVHILFYACRAEENLSADPNSHDRLEWVEISNLHGYDFLEADRPFVEKLRVRQSSSSSSSTG